MADATTGWRDLLGEARVLVSGFGKWGGGLYDLTTGVPEALDDLPTSGLAVIDFACETWRKLHPDGGRLERFVSPRSLAAADRV